ncbi:MAG TPA: peroxide stress protein YaaA [Saprospiraceae bacterium]|nr:peroxide stress protein YaaA [Saprospiraceae bacterium]
MGLMILLSPAKTLDFSDHRADEFTQPRLLDQSKELVGILKKKQAEDLMSLMNISEKLGTLNYERYQEFSTPFNEENAKQAILAFKGDVYTGLEAADLSESDLAYAQNHVRILSGLYGLLRPLDLMQAYRLEMGTKLDNPKGDDLYAYWGEQLTEMLNDDLEGSGNDRVLNLASKEYFSALQPDKLKAKLVEVDFRELRDGKYKFITYNAKKARGTMTKLIIQQQVETIDDLKELDVDGYRYNEDQSDENKLFFSK